MPGKHEFLQNLPEIWLGYLVMKKKSVKSDGVEKEIGENGGALEGEVKYTCIGCISEVPILRDQ